MPDGTGRRQDDAPGGPRPEGHPRGDQPRPAMGPTRARAGQILHAGLMRRVLVISLALIIVAFAVIYLVFFIGEAEEEAAPPDAPAEEEVAPAEPPAE